MKKSTAFLRLCKKHDVDPELIPEIKSFEDACKATKTDPKKLPIVSKLPRRHQKRIIADYKLSVIADALRQEKTANYNDPGEYKYFCWFKVKADAKRPSGFGLSVGGSDHWSAYSPVVVRLCFPTRDMAIYFGKQFIKLHVDHHLLT